MQNLALTAHQLSKSYGLNIILHNITFSINRGERVGLIGPNGCGKTTLLRLLAGVEAADSGHVAYTPANLRIGYLSQSFEPDPTLALAQLLQQAVGNPDALEAELLRASLALADTPDSEQWQQRYDDVLVQLSRYDNGRIQTLLHTFALDKIDPEQCVGTLSGGQKTRLALALLLLDDPQLLILDEPTNHLDIVMLEWLERWLNDFAGGALIVSHDRTFLNQTVTRILDLDPQTQTLRTYAGNYSDYLSQYLKEHEKQWSAYKDQVYEVRRIKQDINRLRNRALAIEKSTSPRQPSLRVYAKKMMKRVKSQEKKLTRYEVDTERVEKPKRSWQMKLDFGSDGYIGRDVLRLESLAVGYTADLALLHSLNLDIQMGQRVALTGGNGAGKSTLLRTIAGHLQPLAGHVHLGHTVRLGYMAQEQELLDMAQTPLQTIQNAAPLNQTDARSFLHYFLFSDDDPLQRNAHLSFGQRARLQLALLVAQGCNFLLLDEPINHLDIPSRTRFEQALAQFEGTVLAVVHDRFFIEQFATDIWHVHEQAIQTTILRE